ncbi:MAG: hypothetical protein K6T99_03040 [Armatimonadetes bacterium]|nr:hypothetical protein [Armatimonadota bacterium]
MGLAEKRQAEKTRYFERFSLNRRIQHIVLMFSFTLLVITGLPVRYSDSQISATVIQIMGGFTARAILHRVGAIILICLAVYHVIHTALTHEGRNEFRALLPRWKDFTDLFHMLKYFFALAKSKPKFDRYNYIEKFEYFAVSWGSVVMILTGFILWFEDKSINILPLWALDVARAVHSWEALLAFLTILIWHMYHVHLKPGHFPMDRVWIDGKISEDKIKHNHPLEYERIVNQAEKE